MLIENKRNVRPPLSASLGDENVYPWGAKLKYGKVNSTISQVPLLSSLRYFLLFVIRFASVYGPIAGVLFPFILALYIYIYIALSLSLLFLRKILRLFHSAIILIWRSGATCRQLEIITSS